jgi:hypothetical protein
METSITTATNEVGGGLVLASFGSGDSGGRTQASARRGNANANASARQVSSARSRISRNTTLSARRRRQLLQEIDDNRRGRAGGVRARVLADILDSLND